MLISLPAIALQRGVHELRAAATDVAQVAQLSVTVDVADVCGCSFLLYVLSL